MASFVRGILGRALVLVLLLIVLGAAYAVFIQFPTDATLLKVAASLIVLAVTLSCAMCGSLTLGTRYVAVGVLGIAGAFLAAVTSFYAIWGGSPGSGMGGLPSTPAEAMESYVGSTGGNQVAAGFVIAVALTALALPLINITLRFAYESNPVAEILGLVTVGAVLGNIVIIAVTTATGSSDATSIKWTVFLSVLSAAGIIATPAAAAVDVNRVSGNSRAMHYDITSDVLPSALPKSFQSRSSSATEDPTLPTLDYSPDDKRSRTNL